MTKDEALKLGIESLEWHNQHMHRKISEQAIAAMKKALAQPEQDWIERERAVGYREGHQNALKQMAQLEQEQLMSDQINYGMSVTQGGKRIDPMSIYKEPEQKPVATDWERIARVQNAKLRAMCDEAGGFEKLCEVMDKYERTTPPQRKPLTDEEINEFFQGMEPNNGFWLSFARAIEAAHGIKGEV